MTIQMPETISSAFATVMSGANDSSSPSLTAPGATIQGSTIGNDGSFLPQASYELTPGSSSLSCYIPALSAVLIETV